MKNLSSEAEMVVALAKEVAREDGQGYVGTEHLLMGIVQVEAGLGAKILAELGVNEAKVADELKRQAKDRLQETWVLGRLPGTPHFRDVLSRATEAAKGTGNWQIRSEHVLLALVLEKASTGYKALAALGVTMEEVRRGITRHRDE